MLTYENVINAPLDKLETAATDWKAMVEKLDEMAEAARNGMKAKADKAQWNGVTAGVGREFVAKTAKEFDDAAKEAKGIHQALTEGLAVFKSSKEQLKKIAGEEAPAAGFQVDAAGRVSAIPLATEGDRNAARHDADYQQSLRENRTLWQQKIDAVIDNCDDVDQSLARMLGANVTDGHDFSGPKYGSLDAEQAGRATELAKKGRGLTHDELVELNELLSDNQAVPEFSTAFYEALGPKGTLEFFGQLSVDTGSRGYDQQRLKDIQELQQNLGLNLATATDPDHPRHLPDRFAQDLRRLGTERIPLVPHDGNHPFGYQILGGIMRYGNYDPRFLVPIADHATQVQAKDKQFFFQNKAVNGLNPTQFNPSGGSGAGFDPVNSFLEALGHSPEAATEFFKREKAELVAYNQDGTVKAGVPNLGKDVTNYLDYFANEKYESLNDSHDLDAKGAEKAKQHMPDALGHALEAATLGHAWDDPSPELKRSDDTAGIMKDVVQKYGGDAGLLKQHEALADSVGRMTAGYIDDINSALTIDPKQSVFANSHGEKQGHLVIPREGARDLLAALGQHPDAYATVSTAERIYSASVLESQGVHEGKIDEGRAQATIRTTAEVQGILDESRAEQVKGVGEKKHEEYEKAHEKQSAWVEFGTTSAIAAGVAFLPATVAAAGAAAVLVPLAVDLGSGAVEQAASQVIGEWSDKAVEKHKDKSEGETHDSNKSMFQAGEHSAEAPMKEFMRRHNIDPNSDFGNEFIESMRIGYETGNSIARQQGHEPQTKGAK
ncbi:hypothetical protein [Streptomyces sp. NBC_01408]|uniref:hypothetical protein n=1 Tax=Streptomyces sp. NBC_01408 TaxID=2903855 RepID=UPI00224D4B33|nr:hypothetical protein [Streptomyces sp. NBC_01408]MCX4693092.1 hypothetical protein [Streptomyces sp. NBC_01408]